MIAIKATITALDIIFGILVMMSGAKSKNGTTKVISGLITAMVALNAILVWY